jgi:hypothetical protein
LTFDFSQTTNFQFDMEGLIFEANERTGQQQLEQAHSKSIYPLLFDARTRMKDNS